MHQHISAMQGKDPELRRSYDLSPFDALHYFHQPELFLEVIASINIFHSDTPDPKATVGCGAPSRLLVGGEPTPH